jgi:hypothetical protein
MPTPNVAAKWAMSEYPCWSLKPARYPLTDHFPLGRMSAVGTNHRPVSPRKVVLAGRVSRALSAPVPEDVV